MRGPAAVLAALGLLLVPSGSLRAQDDPAALRDLYARGVVGLKVTYQDWDEDRPWAKKSPSTRGTSAVLVDPTHLLTTADNIDNASFIQLSTFGQPRQAGLEITLVDRDVNLALLRVGDSAVLQDLQPVPIARQTPGAGTFQTVRWLGQQLEASASRVARFLVERSRGSRVEYAYLHMRTDMSGGGWSEPVFNGRELVGITLSQSGQDSRAIPAEIISGFMDRAASEGPYVGFPALGVHWQLNHDSALTRYLGQTGEPRGILVRQVPWGSSGCGVLHRTDILLAIDDHAIDADGTYNHPRLGRLQFTHLLAESYRPGDTVTVRVWRDREEIDLPMTLRRYPAALDLIPTNRNGPPHYFIAGGLVFRELDVPYLGTWGKEWNKRAPDHLLSHYHLFNAAQTETRRRLILITTVFPSDYNIGYQSLTEGMVARINGRTIGSIQDVAAAFEEPQGAFHVIDLAPESGWKKIVLDAATLEAATEEILRTYSIPQAARLPVEPLPEGGGSCEGEY